MIITGMHVLKSIITHAHVLREPQEPVPHRKRKLTKKGKCTYHKVQPRSGRKGLADLMSLGALDVAAGIRLAADGQRL